MLLVGIHIHNFISKVPFRTSDHKIAWLSNGVTQVPIKQEVYAYFLAILNFRFLFLVGRVFQHYNPLLSSSTSFMPSRIIMFLFHNLGMRMNTRIIAMSMTSL